MKLRQKSKRDQTLDAAASVAKTWSEWRLGEKVARTTGKAAKSTGKAARKAKNARASSGGRGRLKIAGAIALVGGIGAAVAKKLSGGKAEPLYTPPGPAPDMAPPPPSPVAVGDLADRAAPSDTPDPPPVVIVEDLASDTATAAEQAHDAPADDAPANDAPANDAPANDAPANDAPADDEDDAADKV